MIRPSLLAALLLLAGCLPEVKAEGPPPVLSSADLQMILAGLDPRQVKRQKLWTPGPRVNS